jgi:adenylate cyclase
MRGTRRWLDMLVPALLLLGALALRIDDGPWVQRLRLMLFDTYQTLAPRTFQSAPVRIVDIDEESLARIGQWPWPRSVLAELVDRLRAAGAVTVGFDILLAEPDRTAPRNLAEQWGDAPAIAPLREALLGLPDPDALLAAALQRMPTVGVFALGNQPRFDRPPRPAGMSFAGDDPLQFVPSFTGATAPLVPFGAAYAGLGFSNFVPDADGIVRRVPLLAQYDGEIYPSFAAEMLRVAQGAAGHLVKSSGASGETSFGAATGIVGMRVGAAEIPTDATGSLLLYDSGHRPERFLPAWQVLDGSIDAAFIAGHLVLVGTSASGLRDIRTTPLEPALGGVEIHAQLLEQALTGDFLYRPDWADGAEILYLLLIGVATILLIRRSGAAQTALVAAGMVALSLLLSWAAFHYERWLVDPLSPCVAALAVYLAGSLLGYMRTEGERQQIRSQFRQYVSPALVDRLSRHPEALRLGGETRELTILFSDIRGFTDIAERLDPEALTRLINGFLTPMTRVIQSKSGTIDKYIGDCVMAFWNAPLSDADHARHALEAALAMRAALADLNERWIADARKAGATFEPLAIGIGINTGRCSVGNFGSDQRFDYSVLGDSVNLASRLEGLSRLYGTDIVVGAATAAAAPDFALIEIDRVRVKGRAQPEAIHALLGDAGVAGTPDFAAMWANFGALLAAYRNRDFAAARAAIRQGRGAAPALAPVYDLYEDRIAIYEGDPPVAGWDGVFEARTKTG